MIDRRPERGQTELTLQELSQHYKLRERLAQDEEILQSLRDAAGLGAQVLTGMPHAPGVHDKVGDLAIEIADMEERVRFLRAEVNDEARTIELWIEGIQSDQLRTIFRLRFLRCLTWGQVADVIGGGNSESSVKMMCYRFLDA